jgi:hypothetical protein
MAKAQEVRGRYHEIGWNGRFFIKLTMPLIGVTSGTTHRHAYHVTLLLKKLSAWQTESYSTHLQHDRLVENLSRLYPLEISQVGSILERIIIALLST